MCIYIYKEKEKERDLFAYIYIYIHTLVCFLYFIYLYTIHILILLSPLRSQGSFLVELVELGVMLKGSASICLENLSLHSFHPCDSSGNLGISTTRDLLEAQLNARKP